MHSVQHSASTNAMQQQQKRRLRMINLKGTNLNEIGRIINSEFKEWTD